MERGVSWPSPRFEDNGVGTVTDHLTGLIWLKDANSAGTMSWSQAMDFCYNLTSGQSGLTDGPVAGEWRPPNRSGLMSLVDYGRNFPALPQGYPFLFVPSSDLHYWSATTYAGNTSQAWIVDMNDGYVGSFASKSLYKYIWPVRGGTALNNGLVAYYPFNGK